MAKSKKYYWLKLKRDFFKRHDIRIVEAMPNGKDYILFYLKLMLESIDHNGALRFNDTIPYNEQMLSVVTNTNIDIVRSALNVFADLDLITVFDDKTIYMAEVEKMIGSAADNDGANRVRRFRERQKCEALQNVTLLVTKCNESKSIEKDIDIDIYNIRSEGNAHACARGAGAHECVFLTDEEHEDLYNRLGAIVAKQYIKRLDRFIFEKGATVADHFNTILKWWEEDNG